MPVAEQVLELLPTQNVFDLYYAGKKSWRLFGDGILRLIEIPDSVELTDRQTIQRKVALTGQPHINQKALARFLKKFKYPVGYLDFETLSLKNAGAVPMNPEIERNLGEQPIARLMREHNLKPHDLVAISSVEMTHKMVARACKGRRLTVNTQSKVLAALNRATRRNYSLRDLFNY